MTGAKCTDLVLKDKLKICVQQFTESTGKRPVVIEDNASCHRAKIAVSLLHELITRSVQADFSAVSPEGHIARSFRRKSYFPFWIFNY